MTELGLLVGRAAAVAKEKRRKTVVKKVERIRTRRKDEVDKYQN